MPPIPMRERLSHEQEAHNEAVHTYRKNRGPEARRARAQNRQAERDLRNPSEQLMVLAARGVDVSKMSTSREVIRLRKQVDELVATTNDDQTGAKKAKSKKSKK